MHLCLEKRERGRIQGLSNLLSTIIISGTGKVTNFKFGRYIHRVHPNKSPLKIWEKKRAWAYPGSSQVFRVPPIISGARKATNFKFGRYSYGVHPNKSPLKIWEKRERGRIQGLPKVFEYPLLSQERVKLRNSNFVRTFLVSNGTNAHYKFREK